MVLTRPAPLSSSSRTPSPAPWSSPSSARSSTSQCRVISGHRQRRQLQQLKRYLFLTSLDLFLNLPSVSLRLTRALGCGPFDNIFLDYIFPAVTYVLYYGQFCINILYLWVLVRHQDSKESSKEIPSSRSPIGHSTNLLGSKAQTVVIQQKSSSTCSIFKEEMRLRTDTI